MACSMDHALYKDCINELCLTLCWHHTRQSDLLAWRMGYVLSTHHVHHAHHMKNQNNISVGSVPGHTNSLAQFDFISSTSAPRPVA